MNLAYLLLGGNIGNSKNIFNQAQLLIDSEIGSLFKQSSDYQSKAWGFESSSFFLNRIVIIKTNLSPSDLLKETQKIEIQLGRKEKTKETYESRIIDIDILFYENKIIQTNKLTIPHPRLHLRRFTLEPLLELSSDFTHPILQKTIANLYQECEDQSKVIKVLD